MDPWDATNGTLQEPTNLLVYYISLLYKFENREIKLPIHQKRTFNVFSTLPMAFAHIYSQTLRELSRLTFHVNLAVLCWAMDLFFYRKYVSIIDSQVNHPISILRNQNIHYTTAGYKIDIFLIIQVYNRWQPDCQYRISPPASNFIYTNFRANMTAFMYTSFRVHMTAHACTIMSKSMSTEHCALALE